MCYPTIVRRRKIRKICCRASQPSIMFSYKPQVDDAMDEDTVSLPHQQSFSSLKTDSDYIYQVHTPSFHMPLYASQTLKSPSLKHKTSLHSLTSTKHLKDGSGHNYDSSDTLYRSSSGIKNLTTHLSTGKGTSDLRNYPLTKSDNFIHTKNSSPEIKFYHTYWKSRSTSQFKYGGPSSVSNPLLPPSTASNFLYKPGTNDSNTNLFSLTRKGSLEYEQKTYLKENVQPRRSLEIPPLENTLQSILDKSASETVMKDDAFTQDVLTKDSSVEQGLKNTEEKNNFRQYADTAMSEMDVEDTMSDATDTSSAAQQLLLAPTTLKTEDSFRKRKRKNGKNTEASGLSDHLLSLTISSSRKSESNVEADPNISPSHHTKPYTQTDSL